MIEKIVVSDTNIFIDLIDTELIDDFFQIPWEVHTTDMVLDELKNSEQSNIMKEFVDDNKLILHKLTPQEITRVAWLRLSQHSISNVSIPDCSVWLYAKEHGCTLLTGDRKLRNVAADDGVDVHGILFVFIKLVQYDILSHKEAAEHLKTLQAINPRLPKIDIDTLISQWRNTI